MLDLVMEPIEISRNHSNSQSSFFNFLIDTFCWDFLGHFLGHFLGPFLRHFLRHFLLLYYIIFDILLEPFFIHLQVCFYLEAVIFLCWQKQSLYSPCCKKKQLVQSKT